MTRSSISGTALVLTNGLYRRIHAKTAHGLVRGPSRFRLLGVIDSTCAGSDAGELLDGRRREVPVLESVAAALAMLGERPDYCVIGVATKGGVIPPELRRDLVAAARAGLSIVNGLHQLIADDPELSELARRHGGEILDIRRPRPAAELRFWTGDVLTLPAPRVPVLGTDCAMGKRTTATLLEGALARRGIRAVMVYTGQTGWLQGRRHGFIFDATPNDFVPGELEGAVLDCYRDERPDVILLEGQSGLRNPSGPCGSEFIVSMGAAGVILQHAPGRRFFKGFEDRGLLMPPLREEIELIRLLGSEVWAVTLSEEALDPAALAGVAVELERELGLPVVRPFGEGVERVAETIRTRLGARGASS